MHCIHGDQISHIQSTVAKRGPHKPGKRSYPYVKTSFKAQHGRIPIDPAILAAIEHRFIAPKKKEIKNADAQVWGDVRGDQKPETFFFRPKMKD